MEFKWSIDKVTVAQNKLVVQVDLKVTAIDGDNTASASYIRKLEKGDSFTPYDQLTEKQVLDWCFEPEIIDRWLDMNNLQQFTTRLIKDEGEAQVAGQIARQLAQKESEPALPWAVQP